MEIECDLTSIRDEDLLRKMWQQSEDFGRKKEIRTHLYKLRESRLREFYSTAGLGGDIMNPATDLCYGKNPLTPSHGDSLVDQSFQSLKSKEVRDSESPTREIKFRNSGGVAGGVLVPDTTGWNVQTSSEVSPDGRAFRTETLAKTDGVELIPGGRAEFAGRNEQKSSASHQGDDKNFVKKAAESSKTHLQENIVIGDENSGRTEMKSSSVTSSSSKVVSSSSSKVVSGDDPGFDLEPRRLTHQDQQYQKMLSEANTNTVRSEQQKYQRNESNLREESKKYVDMDKASPEYQQHVQYLMSQPGAVVSNIVEYPRPGVKMITTVKKLPDGTTVKTKRYETEASADNSTTSQTVKQQQQQRVSSSSTQKHTTSEKRIQDNEDVFTRLARTRDTSGPVSPRKTPDTPSQDDIHSRLQKSRGEQKFSDEIDQRSTQILRDNNAYPSQSPRNAPTRRDSEFVDNVEVISTNKSVKKDLSQTMRNQKITSDDFIQTERDRYVIDSESPSRKGPNGLPEALVPITPGRHGRPDGAPTNGYPSSAVIQESSKSSSKFSESRRYSTETVESYQHSESHNENQDRTTHGYPSVRRPSEEPKGRSPSNGRPGQDFSTHGFPSVRSDKPTQQYPSDKPSTHEHYSTTERVHTISTDRPKPGDSHPQSPDSTTTTRSNYATNETRRHVTSTTEDFSTHGFPSVRAGTPTRDPSRRPLGSEPAPGESPKRPAGQEPPENQVRKPPSDGFSTHGFPSVKAGSPTDESPRRPSAPEPTNQGRRPTTEDFSTHGFPSVKPGRSTPTQSAPQYDERSPPNRRGPSVDREDTMSVTSDRSNSITYEKRIDAAHQAFARSLRCDSPVDSVRRDSIPERQTPRTSVGSIRNSYSPSKRDGRSPSHESITPSESSRISSSTVTKTHKTTSADTRRPSGPKGHSPNDTIDITLTRKITARPTDKPTGDKPAAGRPSTVKEQSQSAEPVLRKKIFAATEGFLASEGVAQEPILKKEQYYQLGPSDATLPSSRLKARQRLGTTPNTSRRPINTYNTEEEVNTLLDTSTKHTTPTRSAKPQDTKPYQPDTLYSSKPRTKPEGYVSLDRATEINEKHNQTTNKQVSYPHYLPSAPKADRSSPHPERPQTSPSSDRPTKNLPSPAPTTTSTSPHNAPKSTSDRPKLAPSTSPTTKPSLSPTKVDDSTTRFTKTVKVDNAITRDTTKTRRQPEQGREPEREFSPEPEDTDEGYVPDRRRPKSKRPTSDDEGFEPESPRAGSPTSDFEYRRPTQTETYDEEDSIFRRSRKTDKKTVTNEFLDTERGPKKPTRPGDQNEPKGPTDRDVKPSVPRRPDDSGPRPSTQDVNEPRRPRDKENRPLENDRKPKGPTRPEDEPKRPSDGVKPRGSKPPLDRSETFDERCRNILGMETEVTTDRTKRVQDFIETERVDVTRKPSDRSPSPQRKPKQPSDTVSIEDCDDDDTGVPRKYPSDKTTKTATTTKTFEGEYPRDISPSEKPSSRSSPKPRERSPTSPVHDRPKEGSPADKRPSYESSRPRDRSPSEQPRSVDETTVRRTTIVDTTLIDEIDDRSPSSRPRKGSPLKKSPTEIDETTDDDRSPETRPRSGSPNAKSPSKIGPSVVGPRDKSPSKKPTTHDITETDDADDRYPSYTPTRKPKEPKDTDELTVRTSKITTDRTTQETMDDVFKPSTQPRAYPRERSPTEKPYNRSPSRPGNSPRDQSPTDETTSKRTVTTTRTDEIDDRSPLSKPRDQSPTERPYRRIPSWDQSGPRDRSPSEKPIRSPRITTTETTTEYGIEERPRSQSPSERPRKPMDSEVIDETYVQTKKTKDTTDELEVTDRYSIRKPRPTEGTRPEDERRGKSPEKPRGSRPSELYETTVQQTIVDDRRSPLRPSDRSPSPRSKPSGYIPSDRKPGSPRGVSPRRRSPTSEETEETTFEKTTRITKDRKTLEEVDTEERPRGRSPSEKPRGPKEPTDETYGKTTVKTTTDRTTFVDRSPNDRPRETSPTGKPRRRQPTDSTEETVVQKTSKITKDRTTVEGTDFEDRPRDRSPKGKPSPRGYPRDESPDEGPKDYPRGTSPTDKPRRRQPTDEVTEETVIDKTSQTTRDERVRNKITSEKIEVEQRPRNRSPNEKPRGTSPTEKPRRRQPSDDETEEIVIQTTTKTKSFEGDSPRDRPRGTSPSEKPKPRQPISKVEEVVVKKSTKTSRDETTLQEVTDHPRSRSPTEKPRGFNPASETPTYDDRSPKNRPRGSSPTEKPGRRPTSEEIDVTVVQKISKTTRNRTSLDETIQRSPEGPGSRPRNKSPTDKPRGPNQQTSPLTKPGPKSTPRDKSPTEKPRGTKLIDDDRPRGTSPSEKPRRSQPTDEETEKTVVSRTSKTIKGKTTLEEIDVQERSPKYHPRGTSPTEKPRQRRPTDEESDEETDETIKETTIETTTVRGVSPKDRPRGVSPIEKPKRRYPSDEEDEETIVESTYSITKDGKIVEQTRNRSPVGKPKGPGRTTSPSEKPRRRQPTDEEINLTIIKKTNKTTSDRKTLEEIEKRPRGHSPSEKPSYRSSPRDTSPSEKPRKPTNGDINESVVVMTIKTRPRDGSPIDKPGFRTHPRDSSPSSQPRRPRPSEVCETTVRSTTTRKTQQEIDFERRYPQGRPSDQSPEEKPSNRRPSKPTTTSTTAKIRSKFEPSPRDKVPAKTAPSYPRSQPTTEKRVPAELPSPGRKPKPAVGTTTKITTQTIVTKVPASRPKATKDVPQKTPKLVTEPSYTRPASRQPERKHSPSISPDSSPSRPTSEVELESPYRSPNTSPSRKSPSPTRSVKLEDITSSVITTKKTTVSVDRSEPKVTHITTAKFQVSPPTSPTKVSTTPGFKTSPSKKPAPKTTPKPVGSRLTTDKTIITRKTTTDRRDIIHPTDSERDSEVPTDLEDVDSPLIERMPSRKLPVTERKESAPVHRVTQIDRDSRMSRSTSENLIKTPITKRPSRHEPLEPIVQREPTRPMTGKTSPKTERRPSKHLSTKTINLTTFDKVINSEDMENVVIDIQHAKSSREPSPNKIVPTPVSLDLYTGKPRYPDVVTEPEDEPRKKPNVQNIPIFEEETNDFVGCQITEVNEDSLENTTKVRTRKFIAGEMKPQRTTPTIVTGDNVDSDCLLSVHDKVSKFISTAEEVSKPKPSMPFRRDVPEDEVPEDDECLLTVDEKVNKFLKTAESVTRERITSTPKPIERPKIDDLDDELRTDECVLSVSEKVNKFTTKADKLAPTTPQRSPELVARVERQISRQSDAEPESPRETNRYPDSPEDDDGPTTVTKVKQTKSVHERDEKRYTDRQIDILSRPSVWDKKPKSEVKLDDILGDSPEDEPTGEAPRKRSPVKEQPDVEYSKPSKPITGSVSKRKEIFENKTSTKKTTASTKPVSKTPERSPRNSGPTQSPSRKQPLDESDARYPREFSPRYVDDYPEEPEDIHEDVYGTSKSRRLHETSRQETTTIHRSPDRSPIRKASQPETRPTSKTPTRTSKQPEDRSPSRRYSDDSPQHPTRNQPQTDLYMESRKTSEHTTRRRSSTQKYPEDHSPDRRSPSKTSPSPTRKQPVEEPEDYSFSSMREETNKHHTTRTSYRSPKDTHPLSHQTSIPDDEDHDHSPARSTSTISSQKHSTTHRSAVNRLTEDTTSRRPRRPSGNEPSTPTSTGRTTRPKVAPETVAARRNIFESSPGDVSPRPSNNRRPSYMDHTKSSLEHTRKDSIEITKTNFSRKSSVEDEPYEASPRSAVKFGVGLKHKEEPKPKRKLSSSDIPNIEDVYDLELLEEILNIVTSYEQRRRVRAQIRVVKKLLETKTREEVSKMSKITTIRRTSSTRDSPLPRRDTPIRPERYQPSDDIDSESIVESHHHIEEREEIIRERSISPQRRTSKTVTKVTEIRKVGEPSTPKRSLPKKEEPKDSKPIWATKNILKKPSENEKVARALSAKKVTSTSSSSTTSRTQQSQRQRVTADEDCITSSYGIGPTDEDGKPLFGIRALKKKNATGKAAQPSETTKVTGTVITEKYYSENGAAPVGERKVTVYSTNPEDLVDLETQYDRRDSETVRRERLSKDGVTTVTKVQKIGKYKPGDIPTLTDDPDFGKITSKAVRRGSVKEMSEKFIRKESSSSVTEKSSGYPKAGLILRTRTNSGATADAADQYERARSVEYDDGSDNECDVEIRTSRKHSKVTESEDETEIRRKVNTRSFLNSGGSKVTGVDDVLDRMRNADNVVVDGDTLEDREARALLNKFLGASVLMTGMESIIPQKELKRTTTGGDQKQEVKTTRVTKTIKSAATGGNSSSPVARETCDFEEIWDEEILKQLLEKSTSYEERRSIRARLRQLMAEREARGETKASVKAELNNDKNVKTQSADKKVVEQKKPQDDESSSSEYEEIIEEYTASESEEETPKTVTQKKVEVKEDTKTKKIIEEVKKTTITKKEEPKPKEIKKTIVVEKTTIVKKDPSSAPSSVEEKKVDTKKAEDSVDDVDNDEKSKGESLLIPLLQGLLHKNMPQARASKTASATPPTTATANQNSNNLKSSLKSSSTHFSSTSSNSNNSLGNSGLSSEVGKKSSLGQAGGPTSALRVTAQQIEDSGTESGEDLRLIAAGIRDSMQIEGLENQSDMSLIKEVTNALNRLESSLKEGKDLDLDSNKKNTLLALVERLQTGLTAPDKLATTVEEQDFPDETSSPEADNHRSNRQRFAKRRNRNNRHTVGVSKEELADARRYMEEMVMIENLSSCTTPEANAATTPPQFFAIQKQNSTGAILSNRDTQETSSSLFRPNQFVPNNLKHSTEANTEVQMRPKKANPSQRQSTGDMNHIIVDSSAGKRPLSDTYDSYAAQTNRVTFSDSKDHSDNNVQERNEYNRSHHLDNQPDVTHRSSPDTTRSNRFNNKKQLMKRANTIDIPKNHRYNPEFDTDPEFEDKSSFNVKGLRGTVQVSVKRKPRQVVPTFEPKTENDHKFLAFIKKQNATPGLGWNTSKSVSNWTDKFGNIKNVFESAAPTSSGPKVAAGPPSAAKNFWKKADEKNPPKVSSNVLTSALKAKERNEAKISEVVAPKPIHMNKFIHNPQSVFKPIDSSPEPERRQFKPVPQERPQGRPVNVVTSYSPTKAYNPVSSRKQYVISSPMENMAQMERPVNVVSSYSPTKAYNPVSSRKQVVESPNYGPLSPSSWVKQNTATNSPVTLPWTVKPPENSVLKIAATKFDSRPPLNAVQRHQSFKQQEAQKRPSLPNMLQPYDHYDFDDYSQQSYMTNSQPASYADYTLQPRVYRESSLTNPRAEPLVLTPYRPAYSPHSLQPFDYYSEGLNPNVQQSDMTDDDIDDMESMTEYKVEAKVMARPVGQHAVTVGNRTAHMSDDEVFGKNSRAAKSLLSVMKNIGNGAPEKVSKKVERNIAPSTCMSPDGRSYQAPVVEPLFPELTKFENNRLPEYIGPQPHQPLQQPPTVEYQKNPAYVPPVEYQQQQPPVAPPRGRKLAQEPRKAPIQKSPSPYVPPDRQTAKPSARRDAPNLLPLQTAPLSQPSYPYSSPSKTPESSPYSPQIINDGRFMPTAPSSYQSMQAPLRTHPIHSEYNSSPKGYPGPQPPVILPQIPLETSFTKVYDKPREVAPYYPAPVDYQAPPEHQPMIPQSNQRSPKAQQNSQPPAFSQQVYQQQPDVYQSPKIQHSPSPAYAPQGYQSNRNQTEQHYEPAMIQQTPQSPAVAPQQVYHPRNEAPYQSPIVQQIPQSPQFVPQKSVDGPASYYQSPKVQQSPQPPTFAPNIQPQYQSPMVQQSTQSPVFKQDVPPQYRSPKVQQSSQPAEYQSPKIQQNSQQPVYPNQAQPSEYHSPRAQQTPQQPMYPAQYQSPKVQQSPQPPIYANQTQSVQYQSPKVQQSPQLPQYQSPKIQQSQQPPFFAPKISNETRAPVAQNTPKPQIQPKPQVPPKSETVVQSSKSQITSSTYRQQQQTQKTVTSTGPIKQPVPINSAILCKQASLDGRKRVQSQSQLYERVDEVRRKSLGNILETTRLEREAQEQKAAAIKQDMYSVQQDVYSQQVQSKQKIEVRQQETKVYKSSAPDDTPDIVKSSLAKDDIPILKKFGPPQRHCYIPNAYQNPLTKSETMVAPTGTKLAPRKFSEPSVTRGPVIVEIPATPQPEAQDEIPRNIVFNNVNAFTSMSRMTGESSVEYSSQQNRPNKLSKCDSWHQICQLQSAPKPPSPKFNHSGNALRRSKSSHTLALPKLYEAGYDRTQISEKQKTVAAYFGQKSPSSLSRNSSQTNIADETTVSIKKSSINRIKTSEKASISRQNPSSGLSRSHTMPQIANVNLLDESNVEDAFEQLMNESTTTTEKTETKEEDGGVVTTTTKVTTRTISGAPKPVSPFAKFQQLDKQVSQQSPNTPNTPTTPGGSKSAQIFRFTDPALNARAATVKDQLLQWCQNKTQEYENVQITNFSGSWTDGLAFCALIHHFLPDAFDYSKLSPKQRRYNFELAFRVADEKAGIAPLLDVEDMVVMKRPDWKCVFTYVQSIWRRFRNCQ